MKLVQSDVHSMPFALGFDMRFYRSQTALCGFAERYASCMAAEELSECIFFRLSGQRDSLNVFTISRLRVANI